MIKKTSKEQVFRVVLEPINPDMPTGDLKQKFRLVAGGCGIRVLDMHRMEQGDIIPKDVALTILDDIEQAINAALFGDIENQAGQDSA